MVETAGMTGIAQPWEIQFEVHFHIGPVFRDWKETRFLGDSI